MKQYLIKQYLINPIYFHFGLSIVILFIYKANIAYCEGWSLFGSSYSPAPAVTPRSESFYEPLSSPSTCEQTTETDPFIEYNGNIFLFVLNQGPFFNYHSYVQSVIFDSAFNRPITPLPFDLISNPKIHEDFNNCLSNTGNNINILNSYYNFILESTVAEKCLCDPEAIQLFSLTVEYQDLCKTLKDFLDEKYQVFYVES
jgi:hypothetical protein